jgi:hypothetical protein
VEFYTKINLRNSASRWFLLEESLLMLIKAVLILYVNDEAKIRMDEVIRQELSQT